MTRVASLFRCAALCGAALCGCTEASSDRAFTPLESHVDDSGQNSALSFDGVDDYASTGTAQFPDGRSTQTLSLWFMAGSVAGKQALLTLRKDFDSGVEVGLNDGHVTAWRVYGNRSLLAAKTTIDPGTWHHVAYTFDQTNNGLYLDGALIASSDGAPDKRTPTTCWIGTLDGTADLFQGRIDQLRIFDVVLAPEQIAADAAGQATADGSVPVLDLPFDERGGSVVFDHSPLANDGQLGEGIAERMPARVAR